MGKLQEFTINLDNPVGVFQAGQNVTGHVVVDMNQRMKVRGVRLLFHGAANVHWEETQTTGSGKDTQTVTNSYKADETYFNFEITLFGNASGGDHPHHPVGRHMYPFQFTLPPNLPSSFEGSVGRVHYWLMGTIDKPWKFDHTCKRPFTVLSILDLNLEPDALTPRQGQNAKTLCCLCCRSGPISAVFRIDKGGFVPGEYIILNGEVDNKSNRTMVCSKVKLSMIITYHATTKTRVDIKTVAQIQKGRIPPGESEIWAGERLHIPPLPPSALTPCRIIDIQYLVMLIVDPSGPAFDLELPLNITIGTIPLRNLYGGFEPMPSAPAFPPALPPGMPLPPPSQPTAPDAGACGGEAFPPPPSYEKCVLGKVDLRDEGEDEHVRGDMNWAPVYPYFAPPPPDGTASLPPPAYSENV